MPKEQFKITDKDFLMELKTLELKTPIQKELLYRYISIAEHYIFIENQKEGELILKNLGFNKKVIKSFVNNINREKNSEFSELKEIMTGKVPKRLLN